MGPHDRRSKTCYRLLYLNQQPVIHERPKVPSKSAREMTETKPHCVDDHLVYVERERERSMERLVKNASKRVGWDWCWVWGVGSPIRDWYLLRGEMADNVGKRERSLGSRVLTCCCCEFERERERARDHGVDKFGRHSPVGTRSPESVSVRGAPYSHIPTRGPISGLVSGYVPSHVHGSRPLSRSQG